MRDAAPMIAPTDSIRRAVEIINRSGRGAVLVVDETSGRLRAIITDGDIRRAILEGIDLDGPLYWLDDGPRREPLVAPVGTDRPTLLALMRGEGVRHIPLIDPDGRVAGLVTLDDLAASPPPHAVILAGGFGTRLRPLTDHTPKTMLPIAGRPLLERTVGRLQRAGISRVWMMVHHQPEQVVEHFGNGEGFGVEVHYLLEDEPLGTAGALGAVASNGAPVLVLNGDLLLDIDYRAMLAYHQDEEADLTLAVQRIVWRVPYGVVDCDGCRVTEIVEKPAASVLVNCGVYVLESYVQRSIPVQRANMTDVVAALLAMGRPVAAFPLSDREYWLDVGSPATYAQANEDAKAGRFGE